MQDGAWETRGTVCGPGGAAELPRSHALGACVSSQTYCPSLSLVTGEAQRDECEAFLSAHRRCGLWELDYYLGEREGMYGPGLVPL